MGMATVSPDDVDTTGEIPPMLRGWNPTRITFTGKGILELLPILIWPNPKLNVVASTVTKFDIYVEQLIDNMLFTMRSSKGIGLAAPQVGVSLRVIVLEVEPNYPCYFINPVILSSDGTYQWEEGCLSVPGYFETRSRPGQITIETSTINGNKEQITLQGLYAFALQHEIDHLNGKVFVDDSSQLRKERAKSKIKKTLRRGNRV